MYGERHFCASEVARVLVVGIQQQMGKERIGEAATDWRMERMKCGWEDNNEYFGLAQHKLEK